MTDSATIGAEPKAFRWQAALYHQMAETGWFRDHRVELVRGEIVTVSPMGSMHWVVVDLVSAALSAVYAADKFVVTDQCPVSLSDESEPDVAVIRCQARDFLYGLPSSCEIVVEVPDSSLTYDRTVKRGLYAEAGIPEYWIVDVTARTVDVNTDPYGSGDEHGYRSRRVLGGDDTLTPLSAANASISVADLLP